MRAMPLFSIFRITLIPYSPAIKTTSVTQTFTCKLFYCKEAAAPRRHSDTCTLQQGEALVPV